MKTKIKLLRPDQVWQPKVGGKVGNRNALKTGRHTAEKRALRRQIALFRIRAAQIAAMVEARVSAEIRMVMVKQGCGARLPVAWLPQRVGFLQPTAKSRSVSGAFP